MRTSRRTEMAQLAVIALMFAAGIATLPTAPASVPMGWNAQGQVTAYGDAAFALLMPPVLALAAYAALRIVPLIDPGRANYPSFAGVYTLTRWVVLLFIAGAYALIHLSLRGAPVDVGAIAPLGVGLMLIVIGNVMGKVRPNWFIGIRTPWTLSSKRSWTRTHAVGGRVFVGIGIVFALVPLGRLVGLRAQALLPVAVTIAMAGVAYLFVYSFLAWRDDPDRVPPAGTLPAEPR